MACAIGKRRALQRFLVILFPFCFGELGLAQPAAVPPSIRAAAGEPRPPIAHWRQIEDLPQAVAQFETVFWDPRDTPSLRKLLRTTSIARDKSVLEIGVGTGLLSLCALQNGARHVVGTDINSRAVENARFNAARLGWQVRFDCRQVTKLRPGAFEVIQAGEKFDLILSNPPWVNRQPKTSFEFALYDPGFNLLKTLLDGLPRHLNPGGRVLLAYGSVSGIQTVFKLSAERGYRVTIVDDDRQLEKLPEEFLPGMLLEVTVPAVPDSGKSGRP